MTGTIMGCWLVWRH